MVIYVWSFSKIALGRAAASSYGSFISGLYFYIASYEEQLFQRGKLAPALDRIIIYRLCFKKIHLIAISSW